MRKVIIVFFIILAFTTTRALGQANSPFLEIPTDARSAGLGNTGIALNSGAYSIYNNMSAVAFNKNAGGAFYALSPWKIDESVISTMHTLGVNYRVHSRHTLAIAGRYMQDRKTMYWSDENGNPIGDFKPWDMTVDLGYAFAITDRMAVSANLRYLSSKISDTPNMDTGTAFGVDLGFTYRLNKLNLAFTLKNLGTKYDYGAEKQELPTSINIGAAYDYSFSGRHKLTGVAEVGYKILPSDYDGIRGGLGVEYSYGDYVAVRAGYHFGDKKKTLGNFATVGIGVGCKYVSFDVAYWLAGSSTPVRDAIMGSAVFKF